MTDSSTQPAVYRSYAKVNLYLDVLERRTDGFTNIETIFQTINLSDELTFAPAGSGTRFTCNQPDLADPDNNLVCRAVALLRQETGATQGISVHLEKRIPVAAGLAGGSGNAAATLVALNAIWDLNLEHRALEALAGRLGSDVPYCLIGGTAAATGRGELLEPLAPIAPQWLVLVHPPRAISAGFAYGHPKLTRNTELAEDGKTPAFRGALARLAQGSIAEIVFNRMESGVFNAYPDLADIKARLLAYGCTAGAMSGSGPTVFGICAGEKSAIRAARQFNDYPVSVLQTAPHGIVRDR